MTHGRVGDGATFSEDGRYRYVLWRTLTAQLAGAGGAVTWIMCNPSKAGAVDDDPTLRKCLGFTERWGFSFLTVVNLFAYVSTYPELLAKADVDVVHPRCDLEIERAVVDARRVVLAWGSPRDKDVRRMVRERAADVQRMVIDTLRTLDGARKPVAQIGRLSVCKDGSPGHPLMLGYDRPFEPIEWRPSVDVSGLVREINR